MGLCEREYISQKQKMILRLEATEDVRDDTTRYQRQGLLIFYQLLLPLYDTSIYGIREDKLILYYSEVQKWSNLYAYQIGLGESYGHSFKNVNLSEIVCHDEYIVKDGIRGGNSGAIYRHWQMGSDYDDYIARGMNYRSWLQIKE